MQLFYDVEQLVVGQELLQRSSRGRAWKSLACCACHGFNNQWLWAPATLPKRAAASETVVLVFDEFLCFVAALRFLVGARTVFILVREDSVLQI
mmetsp:Transcript_59628/g.158666  ORF Transcript_59628/g.158666 Transcript_59628/m.158666 type:complete len:94 (-) Transcript_59628:178-459(-)